MKNIAAIAVAALGISAGAVGLAQAGPGDPPAQAAATTTTTSGPKAGGRPGAMGPVGHAVHGDLIVRTKDGTFETVALDRGTLTAVSATSLTLHRPDGVDVTVKLDGDTRYRGVENAGALQKDQPVAVVSKDGTARVVMQRDPDAPQRRPGMRRPGGRPGAPPAAAPSSLEG
ncbi:MAG: hypothetical protein QOG87_1389 [Actinomycetota bacterium]|jgi:hypothetical protein